MINIKKGVGAGSINITVADKKFPGVQGCHKGGPYERPSVSLEKFCTPKELNSPRLKKTQTFLRPVSFYKLFEMEFCQTKTWQLVETFESQSICFLQQTKSLLSLSLKCKIFVLK